MREAHTRRYEPVLVGSFFLVAAVTIFRHEMWMDELNTWDVVRDAGSLTNLFANMHLEVHPGLWYLVLYPVTRVTTDPRAMQLLHLAIATATAGVIVYLAPFHLWQRALLVFGYFFVYEFTVISRGYSLGLLAAVAACAAYVRHKPPTWVIAFLLGVAANTSFYGLLLATAMAIGMAASGRLTGRTAPMAALFYLAAVAVAMITLYPTVDNVFAREWHSSLTWGRFLGTLNLVWTAYVPLPDVSSPTPWNSNLLAGSPLMPAIGFVLLALGAVGLSTHRSALATYVTGSAAILIFVYLKYSGGLRHHGHLFIVLLVALWMASADSQDQVMPQAKGLRAGVLRGRWRNGVWTALLGAQVAAGAYFVVQDVRLPFSVSKDLATYVRALPAPSELVVAHPDFLNFAGPALSGYLQTKVSYVLAQRVVRGSFMKPDSEHRDGATPEQIVSQVQALAAERNHDVYIVTNNWSAPELGRPVARFDRHLEGDERSVEVYVVHPLPAFRHGGTDPRLGNGCVQ